MGRKRVQISPEPIRFNRNIASAAPVSTFENGVLNEVADAIQLGSFMPGATADPDSGRNRPQTGHVLSDYRDAVGESG